MTGSRGDGRLDWKVEELQRDIDDLKAENKALREIIFGKDASDKASVVYQLQSLSGSRAIAVWVVSILTGLGTPIVATAILIMLNMKR